MPTNLMDKVLHSAGGTYWSYPPLMWPLIWTINHAWRFNFEFHSSLHCCSGKLKVLDDKWIQVIFEAPKLKVGALDFQYGGESEVKLEITYIDEKIRLGKGSRGSLFVFQRRR